MNLKSKGQVTETTSKMVGGSSIQPEVTALLIPGAHDAVSVLGTQQVARQSGNMHGTYPSGRAI